MLRRVFLRAASKMPPMFSNTTDDIDVGEIEVGK